MQITFVQAPLGRSEPLVYPLGIVTLAGTLPDSHEISILDPNQSGMETVQKILQEQQPDVLCLSIRNLDSQIRRDLFYYYLYLKKIIRTLRDSLPQTTIIAGGSGFSLFPKRIMEDNPGLDLGVFLEADELLPLLIQKLDEPDTVKGVYYRDNGNVCYTGDPPLPVVEAFGRPRYDLLDPLPYEANGGVGVQTKRGCPLSCIYCTYPHLNGRCLRMLPVDDVISQIRDLSENYGIKEITFVDGVFNLPARRTMELLDALKQSNVNMKWRGWFTEIGFDGQMAELCRDSGCPEFSFSPDGYSTETLKALGKKISMADIENVFQIAKQTPGIKVAFNFFWNPPGQTLGTWLKMIIFTLKCKLILREKAGGIIFGNARIEPHTPLWQISVDHGLIQESTDLLPETDAALRKVFYSNRSTRYLDWLYALYTALWRLKNKIK